MAEDAFLKFDGVQGEAVDGKLHQEFRAIGTDFVSFWTASRLALTGSAMAAHSQSTPSGIFRQLAAETRMYSAIAPSIREP